ncbi:Caspase domain protein [Phycisphaerae bacterium RAS2]|nr:Caspase domain protein [Phycisphaerae bacterium RAS2]
MRAFATKKTLWRAPLVAGVWLALLAPEAGAAVRVLLVGVSEYADAAVVSPAGAANDVRAMRETLTERYGLGDAQVRALVGKAATREAILDSLGNWLLKNATAGDELVFYFSGHGSNRPDDNGDEDDGQDEILCPSDYVQETGQNGIVDDELGEMLRAAAEAHVLVILDACHSGTATKSLGNRLVELPTIRAGRTQARYIPPPRRPANAPGAAPRRTKGITTVRDLPAATFSACRDHQRAVSTKFMIGGRLVDHGAFTYMLVQGMAGAADADGDKAVTLAELDAFVERSLRQSVYQFEQQPQLLVHDDEPRRRLLGTELRVTPVTLAAMDRDRYRVNLGALDGLAAGGRVQITVQDRGIRPQLAVLETSDAHSAVVRLEEKPPAEWRTRLESNQAIGVSVAPASLPVSENVLRVWLGTFFEGGREAMPPKAIIDALGRLDGVQVVRGEADADRLIVGEFNGARLKLAVALRSERIIRVIEGTEAEVVHAMREQMEAERAKQVIICMQDPGGPSRVKMRTVDGRTEFVVRRTGEKDYLELEIDVPADGFLMLLNVDGEGTFTQLFPNQYHPDGRVSAGRLRIPQPGKFKLPINPPAGRDLIKAIWSRAPLDAGSIRTKSIAHGMVQITRPADALALVDSIQRGLIEAPRTKGFVPEAAVPGTLGADLGWSCDAIFIDTFDEE